MVSPSAAGATVATLEVAVEFMQRRWLQLKPAVEALRRSHEGPVAAAVAG